MAYQKQTWEDLPSQNTPITANRLNHIEDGIADVETGLTPVTTYTETNNKSYACNYVNGVVEDLEDSIQDVYSTSEVLTNEIWIDNKPIYRKVFTGTLAGSTTVSLDISSLNCEFCYLKKGTLVSAGGPTYEIPYNYGNDTTLFTTFEITIPENKCYLRNGSSSQYTRGTYYIVLEYTKTTD